MNLIPMTVKVTMDRTLTSFLDATGVRIYIAFLMINSRKMLAFVIILRLVQSLCSSFSCFFPDYVFNMIATETNRYAEQVQAEKRLDSKWHPTTAEEMKLYIAVNVMMGIHILSRVENYWSTDDKLNVPCISRLKSRTRSEKLGQYLHLNDRSDYTERGQ